MIQHSHKPKTLILYFVGDAIMSAFDRQVTLSTYQLNNWGNLMEKMVQGAMETTYDDISFREGLPMNYTDYMGVQHEQSETPERRTFIKRVKCGNFDINHFGPFSHGVLTPFSRRSRFF